MSYPRNAATPKAVVIGRVTKIADGSAVTSGASVRVSLDGADWAAGGGTLSYDATSESVSYAPTQAETNGDVLRIAVYKTGCIGCAATVLMDPIGLPTVAPKAKGGLAVLDASAGTVLQGFGDAAVTVSDAQKVDLNTIKTQTVTAAAGVTVLASVGTAATSTAQTGDAYSYLSTNLGALGANASEAGGTGDHLTALPWNAAWDSEVQSECKDALDANYLTSAIVNEMYSTIGGNWTRDENTGAITVVSRVDDTTGLFTLTPTTTARTRS